METESFRHFPDLKRIFRSADYDKPFTIFDIKGDKYRLISQVSYGAKTVNVSGGAHDYGRS
jgi:mRNA interferase HigB